MKRILITIIMSLALILMLTLMVSATDFGIFDYEGTLSESEYNSVANALYDASNYTGSSFYVGIGYSTGSINSFVSSNGLTDSDMVVLLIENEGGTYYYQMHIRGNAKDNISRSEENNILDSSSVYTNIKSGNLADGIVSFASLAKSAHGTTKNSGDGVNRFGEFLPFIIFGIVAFIVAGGIFAIVVVSKYKKKQRGTPYPFKEFTDLELTNQYDLFITKTVTCVRVRSSSSSSGSRSGGGGGFRSSGRR